MERELRYEETFDNLCELMKDLQEISEEDFVAVLERLDQYFSMYEENYASWLSGDENKIEILRNIVQNIENKYVYYYCMTFLIHITKQPSFFNEFVEKVWRDDALSVETKNFLRWRMISVSFLSPGVVDSYGSELMRNLYIQIYENYRTALDKDFGFIKKEERNSDFVIVTIGQFLTLNHGPTKTILDRCEVLEKNMGKRVYIINTAEFMSSVGAIPCYKSKMAGYIPELSKTTSYSYHGRTFPFFQCEPIMPNLDVFREIISVVESEKPYFILNIGGNSILTELCSNIVPTLTLNTVPSGRADVIGQFQIIGRNITEEDRAWMKQNEIPQDHLIQTLFTSSFKEQTHTYQRRDLGLPEKGFIVLLVGGRLDSEMDAEMESVMERLMEQKIYFAFAGNYERFEKRMEQDDRYKKMGISLGFQTDMLAVYECCDLCLNPRRTGGGTSVAEALYKGIPVVTLDYGDGGLGAGKDFHEKDMEGIYQTILRYRDDENYYKQQSQKARERAAKLTDSAGEFIKAVQKMEESERF